MTNRTDVGRSLPDRQRLGQELRAARNNIGMTQVDLASIAQLRPCTVSYIETAVRDVLASSVIDHAAATGRFVVVAAEHHLPLLDLTAAEVDALIAAGRVIGAADRRPILLSALDKLTTSTEETPA